jgi:uncharacterized membrane protein YfcA
MIQSIFLVCSIVVCASAFSTIIGFGTGTLTMPFALTLLPFGQAYLFVSTLQWFSGLWKTVLFWGNVRWSLVFRIGFPMMIGSALGAYTLFSIPTDLIYRLFGLLLIGYVLVIIFNPDFKLKVRGLGATIIGLALGLFGGLFGIRGPLRSAFLTSAYLSNEEYLCTSGVIGIGIDTVRISMYFIGGMRLGVPLTFALLAVIPVSLLASWYSQSLARTIAPDRFRLVVAGMLFLVGVKLLLGL